MFKIQKIYIKNFLSFFGEHFFSFPDTGFVSLKGNCDDNISLSNGSGKTSFLEAIAYAFDFCSLPATELQNWDASDDFQIMLIVKNENDTIKINRGSGFYSVIFFQDGKESIEYKGTNAKKFIDSYFYSSELISFITYRPQGVFGNFLSLSNTDKFLFLSNLLDLIKIEKIIENSNELIKSFEKEIELTNYSLRELENKNHIFMNFISELEEKIKKCDAHEFELNSQINELKKQNIDYEFLKIKKRNELEQTYRTLNEKKEKNLLEKKSFLENIKNVFEINMKPRNEHIIFLKKSLDGLDFDSLLDKENSISNALCNKRNELNLLNQRLNSKKEIKGRKQVLLNQLRQLLNNTCYTCSQQWISDGVLIENIKKQIQEIGEISDNEDLESIIEKCELEILSLQKKEEDLKKMKILFDKLQKEKIVVQQIQSEYEKRKYIGEIEFEKKEAEIQKLIDENEKELNSIEKFLEDKKKTDINNFNIEIERIKNKQDSNFKMKALFEKDKEIFFQKINNEEIMNLDSNLKKIKFKKMMEEEIINALGKDNFFSLIFQELLINVSSCANDFLSNIPNASNFSVSFDTEKITQSGKVKKGIILKIFQNGKERAFKVLSGGERCAISLAIDAAISKVITNRSGKSFGWVIYDEPFDSMDVYSKMESLELLKRIFLNKLLIIVEHTNDLNEMFDKSICLKKNYGKTEILI